MNRSIFRRSRIVVESQLWCRLNAFPSPIPFDCISQYTEQRWSGNGKRRATDKVVARFNVLFALNASWRLMMDLMEYRKWCGTPPLLQRRRLWPSHVAMLARGRQQCAARSRPITLSYIDAIHQYRLDVGRLAVPELSGRLLQSS